mgnify:CR=1 FL=1
MWRWFPASFPLDTLEVLPAFYACWPTVLRLYYTLNANLPLYREQTETVKRRLEGMGVERSRACLNTGLDIKLHVLLDVLFDANLDSN